MILVSIYLTYYYYFAYIILSVMIKGTLLIVDSSKQELKSMASELKTEISNILSLSDPNRINEILNQHDVDIVLLEMNFHASSKLWE